LKNDYFDSKFEVNEGLLRHFTSKNNLINDERKLNKNDHSKFYKSENFSKQIIKDLLDKKEELAKEKHKKEELVKEKHKKEILFSKGKIEKDKENQEGKNHSKSVKKEKLNKSQLDSKDNNQIKNDSKDNIKTFQENQKLVKFLGKLSGKDPGFIENYVTMTPSELICNYKFRPDHKNKWVSHNNFKV